MKEIVLGNNRGITLVDDEDFELLNSFKWRLGKGRNTDYAMRHNKDGYPTSMMMHRQIMGVKDSKIEVDHKDGNGLNNQRYNLRLTNGQQNISNSRKTILERTSFYKGVSWNNRHNKWVVQIMFKGERYYLGYYDSEVRAALIYDRKAKELFGEFASLNFKK